MNSDDLEPFSKKRCVLDSNPPDPWVEDVLLVIFAYLNEKDLANCEAVCQRWRAVICSGKFWKNIFHRQMNSSSLWRDLKKRAGLNELGMSNAQYARVCKTMFQYFHELERNWLTGKFSMDSFETSSKAVSDCFTMGDGYVAYTYETPGKVGVKILNRPFMEERSRLLFQRYREVYYIDDKIFVCSDPDETQIQIRDSSEGRLIETIGDMESISHCCYWNNLLVAFYETYDGSRQLAAWKLGNGHYETIFLSELDDLCDQMKLDEHYLFVSLNVRIDSETSCQEVYFFSPVTMDIERSLSVEDKVLDYVSGMLLIEDSEGPTRILDVATGTYLRDIPKIPKKYALGVRVRSPQANHVIMAVKGDGEEMKIYDLKANTRANSVGHYSIPQLNYLRYTDTFLVDETQLVCLCKHRGEPSEIIILYFRPTELFKRLSLESSRLAES